MARHINSTDLEWGVYSSQIFLNLYVAQDFFVYGYNKMKSRCFPDANTVLYNYCII